MRFVQSITLYLIWKNILVNKYKLDTLLKYTFV